ncbi:ABC transporter ATP-binding protein [Oceaniglobus roseus]|uniref:ABC transporter ATP-binding protein n=1 Tax=Oceaniglobus roseus TaxID=1737570 RepID=UPI000C7F08F8|nr:ABC transporter ATP-binding protein [Kandeliimicrobium roseum]
MSELLQVEGLKTHFQTESGLVRAVDGVDLSVNEGEVLGLVGESGSGKTITALSLIRLVSPPGKIVAGRVMFGGQDLLQASEREMVQLRGDRISMVFQQPKASLNPVRRVGAQIAELFIHHRGASRRAAMNQAVELLARVGIPAPERKALAYPHELSGGQAQRVMIAMALALKPRLLIADEPTTALDVTIQAQILDLLRELCRDTGTAMILVTHDLGVIAQTADRVSVMYAGQIVEERPVARLFDDPRHPYTRALLASMPVQGRVAPRLGAIPGSVPPPGRMPAACRFAPRCAVRAERNMTICTHEMPALYPVEGGVSRCWCDAPAEATT